MVFSRKETRKKSKKMKDHLEKEWHNTKAKFENIFGEGLEMDGILFLIGVQELGKGLKTFQKDEKMNLIHVAVCKLLEPYGYYDFSHRDNDGWPHFTQNDQLPQLSKKDQEKLLKEAIITYSRTEL